MSCKRIDDYILFLAHIRGTGTQGIVYEGINRVTKQKVAIKAIQQSRLNLDECLKKAVYNEVNFLTKIKSPYVIKIKKALSTKNTLYIVTQLCEKDLRKLLLQKYDQTISEQEAIYMLKDISSGLLALLKEGIIHRDLKPANILLLKGKLKIADLGFSKQVNSLSCQMNTFNGTLYYMSPQLLNEQAYTYKALIWSVGIIFYEILHKRIAWQGKDQKDLLQNIKKQKIRFRPGLSKMAKQFILKCLQIKESNRMTFEEYFGHPIFQDHFKEFEQENMRIVAKYNFLMRRLLFKIISENLNIYKIGQILCRQDRKIKYNFEEFYKLLKQIDQSIEIGQAQYIFTLADPNKSNQILLTHFQDMLKQFQSTQNYQYCESQDCSSKSINKRIQRCFKELKMHLQINRITLYQLFSIYDKKKQGSILYQDYKEMMLSLSKDFTQEELAQVFQRIDTDHSQSIQFNQLNNYFSEILGMRPEENGPNFKKDTAVKVRNWCKKLEKYLQEHHMTLYQVYNQYDQYKFGSMMFQGFSAMIKKLNLDFTQEQLRTVFKCIDINDSKTIQFHELNVFYSNILGISKFINGEPMEISIEQRIKDCFQRIQYLLQYNNMTLYQLFYKFDRYQLGSMMYKQFKLMLQKLNSSFTNQQIKQIFQRIDVNNSRTIQFEELRQYYCKVLNVSKNSIGPHAYKNVMQKIQFCFEKLKKHLQINRITLYQLFSIYDKKKQGSILYQDYKEMMLSLSKDFTQEELAQVFQRIDTDHSQSIQFNQLNNYFSEILGMRPEENGPNFRKDTAVKVRNWCKKLEKYLQQHHMTLYQVYNQYDEYKLGSMMFQGFSAMIKKLNLDFAQEELRTVFDQIDYDKSQSIQFAELSDFYSKTLGIPIGFNIPQQQIVKYKTRTFRRFSFNIDNAGQNDKYAPKTLTGSDIINRNQQNKRK